MANKIFCRFDNFRLGPYLKRKMNNTRNQQSHNRDYHATTNRGEA